MILLNYRNNFLRFMVYISLVLVALFIIVNTAYTVPIKVKSSLVDSIITYNDEITNIDVHYPRFKDEKIDKIISEYIFEYVKNFKSNDQVNKHLHIEYSIYYIKEYANIVFKINNTLDNNKYKNIIINLKSKELSYISNIYDKEFLESNINELVYYKYCNDIFNIVKESNVNNHTYILDDDKIIVYFYDIHFENIEYIPVIQINLNENVFDEISDDFAYDKYIAFTFDDGPSAYTNELVRTLQLNNATATFFMLGNRMKYNPDVVLNVYNSDNEIASHTYSHKNLNKLSLTEIENEINSTEIIYNEITGDTLKYIRPPYGNYNNKVQSFNYPLILWSIDPKDWLYRDSTKDYNEVITNLCDGCIVLMHDIHLPTIDAVKKLLPALNNMGYKVVSIEKLIEIKDYELKSNDVIRKIQ